MSEAEQHAAWASAEANGTGLWCLDPIDGTTNFINGIPFFAVSIAYLVGGRPQAAITYNPVRDELYAAAKGFGATLNGRPLPLRQVENGIVDTFAHVMEQYMCDAGSAPLTERMAEAVLQTLADFPDARSVSALRVGTGRSAR